MTATTASDDAAVTRMLNAFQRDGRAMLEQLLPALHHPKQCPDAMVDGWGDVQAGRNGASTVTLVSQKCAQPDDRTRLLARLRLERDAGGAWMVTVSVIASDDARSPWPPRGLEDDWWSVQRDHIRARISAHRHPVKTEPAV
jgi:hypothetical protein